MTPRPLLSALSLSRSTGVRGRLFDLVDPTEKRWESALAAALGRHMDSIVADSAETCKQCISVSRSRCVRWRVSLQ